MNAKLVLMLLFVLLSSMQDEVTRKREPKWRDKEVEEKSGSRKSKDYSILLDNTDDCLSLTFLFPLNGADITITDGNGNEVVKESQSIIYEGRTISILSVENYPYFVEIISPVVSIRGEVVLEE